MGDFLRRLFGQQTETAVKPKGKQGFASLSPERRREVAAKGGRAGGNVFKENRKRAAELGRKGGEISKRGPAKKKARV